MILRLLTVFWLSQRFECLIFCVLFLSPEQNLIWSIGTMVRTGRGGRGFGRGGRGGFMHKPRAPFIPHVPFDHVMAEPAFPPVKPQNNDHIQEVKHNSCFSGMSTYVADSETLFRPNLSKLYSNELYQLHTDVHNILNSTFRESGFWRQNCY